MAARQSNLTPNDLNGMPAVGAYYPFGYSSWFWFSREVRPRA